MRETRKRSPKTKIVFGLLFTHGPTDKFRIYALKALPVNSKTT